MKLGVIADMHGNAPALEAVLDALEREGVDAIACLGDIVGILGSPDTCVSLVRRHADYVVYGNHDSRVFDDRAFLPQRDVDVLEYELITERLSERNDTWLQNRPAMDTIADCIVLAHCRPTADRAIGVGNDPGVYPQSFEETARTVGNETEIILLGHTHHQHSELVGSPDQETLVCNPGAVGLPLHTDGGGNEGTGLAEYAIVDTTIKECTLRSVRYDATSVIEFLQTNGSPLGMTANR
jgi:putative phosphoesterase